MSPKNWPVFRAIAILPIFSVSMIGCGRGAATTPERLPTLAEYQAKIDPMALYDAKPGDYPKLYKKLGKAAFDRAMSLNDWAALKVVLSDSCDRLTTIDVSDSSSRDEIQWFADCQNGQRFYVNEAEAKQIEAALGQVAPGTPLDPAKIEAPASQSEKLQSFPEVQAVADCDALMKSAATSPSSYKSQWSRTLDNTSTPGKVTIGRRFSAENAFGARLEGQYECTVDAMTGQVIKLRAYQNGEWQTVAGG